jgi:tRNA(Ile)-lysidine synthase TilS/MesJ
MADLMRKIYAERVKQISLPNAASDKLETLCQNFKYGKKLKRAKTIEAMAWQYNTIKNTNNAIVWKDGKFEVIKL